MKVIVFLSVSIWLLNITAGLKCYDCNDVVFIDEYYFNGDENGYQYSVNAELCSKTNKTIECDPRYKFCFTYVYDCETNPPCTFRRCDLDKDCQSVGTHEPLWGTGTLTCCQGDLCNSPEQSKNIDLPSSHNKLTKQICLFHALFSSVLSSVLIWF